MAKPLLPILAAVVGFGMTRTTKGNEVRGMVIGLVIVRKWFEAALLRGFQTTPASDYGHG